MKCAYLLVLGPIVAIALPVHPAKDARAGLLNARGLRGETAHSDAPAATAPSKQCIERRDSLQRQLDLVLKETKVIEAQCRAMAENYEKQLKPHRKMNEILAKRVKDKYDESDIYPRYHQLYTGIMCSKVFKAYHRDDAKERIEIKEICTGKREIPDKLEKDLLDDQMIRNMTSALKKVTGNKDWRTLCPQSEPLEKEVTAATKRKKDIVDGCADKEKKYKAELVASQKETNDLIAKDQNHVTKEPQIKAKAKVDVRNCFCHTIMTYKDKKECQKDGGRNVCIQSFHTQTCIHQKKCKPS